MTSTRRGDKQKPLDLDFQRYHVDSAYRTAMFTWTRKTVEGSLYQREIRTGRAAINFLTVSGGFVELCSDGESVRIGDGSYILYFPPFSILEYTGDMGVLEIATATTSDPHILRQLPNQACLSGVNCHDLALFESNPVAFVVNPDKPLILRSLDAASGKARRIKDWIDSRFRSDSTLSALRDEIDLSASLISRRFKQAYSLSPVNYRTRLRLSEMSDMIMENSSVGSSLTDMAFESGFPDISLFNRQFKDYWGFPPSVMMSMYSR